MLSAARACFTPQKAVNVWERMLKLGPQHGMLTLLSSHPSAKDRLVKLTEWLPRAEQERLAYCARQGDSWEPKKKTKSKKYVAMRS